MAQVDIGFGLQLEEQGLSNLKKLEKTLEDIEKKSKIKIKTESSGGVEDAKEKNKQETIAIQNLQIKQKLIEAENKGYAETQIQLKKLLDINEGIIRQADEIVGKKTSEVITQKQWEELKLIKKKESSIRKQKEEEIRLTQEVNKALLENKKISDSVLKEKTQQQISDQYGGFSKSKELEDMKKFYEQQDKENKKAQDLELQRFNQNLKAKQDALKRKQKEEYDAIARQQSLKDRLFSLETDMIRNNLSRERYLKENEVKKSFQDKLRELQNNKNLREQDLKEFEKYMKRASAINQVNRSNFTSDISQLMVVRQMKTNFERTILTMEKFEDAVYQAGIIGGKTGVEIRQLRNEMSQLGMEIPRTTQEIVQQIGSVARTGRTFEEAVKIVKNASNLAIVSGESLADSVNVLNKVMVAFDINISNTAKTMDILHSATLTTPLDLRAIADGMKNSASAMRNFIENTNKGGQELEDYKTTLLELNTALLGNQMAMG